MTPTALDFHGKMPYRPRQKRRGKSEVQIRSVSQSGRAPFAEKGANCISVSLVYRRGQKTNDSQIARAMGSELERLGFVSLLIPPLLGLRQVSQ